MPERARWRKAVAKTLGYLYVDTGAIYRTIGYYTFANGLDPKDEDGGAAQLLPNIRDRTAP